MAQTHRRRRCSAAGVELPAVPRRLPHRDRAGAAGRRGMPARPGAQRAGGRLRCGRRAAVPRQRAVREALEGAGIEPDPGTAALARQNLGPATGWRGWPVLARDRPRGGACRSDAGRFDHALANPPWHRAGASASPLGRDATWRKSGAGRRLLDGVDPASLARAACVDGGYPDPDPAGGAACRGQPRPMTRLGRASAASGCCRSGRGRAWPVARSCCCRAAPAARGRTARCCPAWCCIRPGGGYHGGGGARSCADGEVAADGPGRLGRLRPAQDTGGAAARLRCQSRS